jgi:hypothetical protein
MKDENKERVVQMKGIWIAQKNASWIGRVGVDGVEEWMVHFTPFPLVIFFLLFLLLNV